MNCIFKTGSSIDREPDEGSTLSLQNVQRPSISAPISAKKCTSSRVHTPPLNNIGDLLAEGSSSTPKISLDGKR